MIARLLSRYADARLRAGRDKAREQRDKFRVLCHQFDHRNQQLRAKLDDQRRALETQAALTERWRLIAQGAQADLRAAREELDINDKAWRAELVAERAAALNQEKQQ